jgi:hypothetical protein
MNGKELLGNIGFVLGVLGGIICFLLSLSSCANSNNHTYITQQSGDILYAIYYILLSLVFFKIGSWSIKRTDALKED